MVGDEENIWRCFALISNRGQLAQAAADASRVRDTALQGRYPSLEQITCAVDHVQLGRRLRAGSRKRARPAVGN